MYLNGIGMSDADGAALDSVVLAPDDGYSSNDFPTAPVGSAKSWADIVSQGIATWGQIETANSAAETTRAVAPYQYRANPAVNVRPLPSGYSPALPGYPAAGAGADYSTLVIFGIVALAAFLYFKD